MENSFGKLGLNSTIVEGLTKIGIMEPTDIQKKVIPAAIEGRDIVGQSETGTGKTFAYLLPMFQRLDGNKREMQALILAPTHELVMQIYREIEKLSLNCGIPVTSAAIIGDVNIVRQIERLKDKPTIIVGSAGRVLELIKKRKISAHTLKTIVIDEADRLLDFNNIESVKAVIKTTLKERHVMLFSATMPEKIVKTAAEFMKDPEIINAQAADRVNNDIEHYYFVCEKRDKIEVLRKLVHSVNPKRAIVFINKSDEIEITTSKLKFHKLMAEGIHGSNIKTDRQRAIEEFKKGKVQLLVASDIAARGLDIKEVTHIFNLDMPEDPKDYLHRVGRTGRAGESGLALSIITKEERGFIKKYETTFGIKIKEKDIYMGRITDI